MPASIFVSPSAARRTERALAWLASREAWQELVVVAASFEAASVVARAASTRSRATFGWHRFTLGRFAATIAEATLAERELSLMGELPLLATCARVVESLRREGALGRFQDVAGFPGLPKALSRTIEELRLAGLGPDSVDDADLARVFAAYEAELARSRFADRAEVLRIATAIAVGAAHPLLDEPLLLFDAPVSNVLERDLVSAVAARSRATLATVPLGDDRTLRALEIALHGAEREAADEASQAGSLARLQRDLFADTAAAHAEVDGGVAILSAPGESRECVEIARRIHREAERGVPFDRIGVLLRAPESYRAHLVEAFARADIPAHFARGTVLPDPAGRAFVSLLFCAGENLSARRFAEYLSLGQVPERAIGGAPPAARSREERFRPTHEELQPRALAALHPSDDAADVTIGTLPAPRRWERLIVESKVIDRKERWARRLEGFDRELVKRIEERERKGDPGEIASALRRQRADLAELRAFALPLLDDLAELRDLVATWGAWLDRLEALATRALKFPDRVLSILGELRPMEDVGPIDLAEVRMVLARRLTEIVEPSDAKTAGKVYVGAALSARGLSFDLVFVPGLAEKIFPQKVIEDPILKDEERARVGVATQDDRVAMERLALRLAVGAAKERVVLTYPRVDVVESRPRVPSFYGLEVLRAAEGTLPGFDELARRAERGAATRIGWPAPATPSLAIDDAEYDLALLDDISRLTEDESVGAAHYLLQHPHLARALRFRGRRWLRSFSAADGIVDSPKEPLDAEARAALAKHSLEARSFSATALQNFSACPYKFALYTIFKLEARDTPEAVEEIDPLSKGSLVHQALFHGFEQLQKAGLLPITPSNLPVARAVLDRALDDAAAEFEEELAPAIDTVWRDGIEGIRADLREMLRRASIDPEAWIPDGFELSFGLDSQLERDERSQDAPVKLDCGIKLRGSIDLVEKKATGEIRASDYKTGKQRATAGVVVDGGNTLQPVLYALALEKLRPGAIVKGGRLYYATSAGGFSDVFIDLDDEARSSAREIASIVGAAIDDAFLPAAPAKDACTWCDFRVVCGPYEEQRTSKKRRDRLVPLERLRGLR